MKNKQEPFNALTDPRLRQEFSENKKAEEVVGKRDLGLNTIQIDLPCELGYHCPVCQYDNIVDGNFDERLAWSEYNGFLYCYVCNKDYPSALCKSDIDEAISIYLSCIKDATAHLRSEIERLREALKETKDTLEQA